MATTHDRTAQRAANTADTWTPTGFPLKFLEAAVTVLSDRGAPTPVDWTTRRSPRSLMGAVSAAHLEQVGWRARR